MAHTWWHSTASPNNSFPSGASPIVANTVSDFFTKTIPNIVFGKATEGIKNVPKPPSPGGSGTFLTPTQRKARQTTRANVKAGKQNVAAIKSATRRTTKPKGARVL